MGDDIRLLEQLVTKAADRLKGLSRERDRLQEEIRALRDRVAELEQSGNDTSLVAAAQGWQAERVQVATELRQTLAELRGD